MNSIVSVSEDTKKILQGCFVVIELHIFLVLYDDELPIFVEVVEQTKKTRQIKVPHLDGT